MKTLISFILSFIPVFLFLMNAQSQCIYFENFSNPSGWTQVGSLVEINNGELQYINGAPDGSQRRVYKQMDTPITNADVWTATFKFRPDDVGTYQGQPFPGHLIFSLTETSQDAWWDCPDEDCTGNPPGTQDALTVSYHAENPPDGTINFRITVRKNSIRYDSPVITYSELGEDIYLVLTKNNSNFTLNIFSDPNHLIPVGDGPVTLNLFNLENLNYIQHGNAAGGYYYRELTGIVDDVCISFNDEECETTYGSFTYQGCWGDGASFTIGNTIYDQFNPDGTEILVNQAGCDSIVTIDLTYYLSNEFELVYFGCQGDGYEVEVNGTLYSESNPNGEELLFNQYGCDSIVFINLFFDPPEYEEINYIGCQGDGYEVIVNGTTYWEGNPVGEEFIENEYGCGTYVTINLVFTPHVATLINYSGCVGDGYEVEVNGTTYWEENPVGEELMFTQYGCDSIIYINLQFNTAVTEAINYFGCQGDGFQIEVNGTTYWEGNPTGEEFMVSQFGCDSLITINLVFAQPVYTDINYIGCQGDGYQIEVNGTTYWEGNPNGVESLLTQNGCDSIVVIDLIFYETATRQITYNGCEGDGYSIEINGNIYNESNPVGVEHIFNDIGCDSIIQVNLDFAATTYYSINYVGCTGDGYFIEVNGIVYDEFNPSGIEILPNVNGCDSIVTIELIFMENSTSDITYFGCIGDEYSVSINGNTYNESNLSGVEILQNVYGCDSIININLVFAESYVDTIFYKGIHGDGYQVKVNGVLYNEKNPKGVEIMETSNGCDSIIYIFLVFTKGKFGKVEDFTLGGFDLYPNPTMDFLQVDIKYEAISKTEFFIRIYNILGELVTNSVSKESSVKLNTFDFLKIGTYYCEVLTGEGESLGIKKFIVTR